MSLAFDLELIDTLLKIAQAAEATPPATSASPEQIKQVALKLVNNLTSQLSSAPAQAFTAQTDNAELSTKHLQNLGELLNFLENNGIAIEGHKLVLKHAPQAFSSGISGDVEFNSLDKAMQALYARFPKGTNSFQYYVYKNGLLQYIQDLRQKASGETPDAKVLRLYLPPLIQQIKDQLDLTVDTSSAEKPGAGQNISNKQKEQGQDASSQNQSATNASWHPGQPLNQEQIQSLSAISNVYPFLPDRIDFRWIDQWLDSYLAVVRTFTGANLNLQNATYAKQYVQAIMNGWGITQQSLTSTAAEIYTMMKSIAETRSMEPNAAQSLPSVYLQYVQKLVLFLESTLLNFKSIYYSSLPPDWKEDLDKQVDNSASSLAAQNKAVVQQWIHNIASAGRQVEGK